MIFVQSPLKRDYIKELLVKEAHEGITFTFVEEKGMKLYFSVDTADLEKAASVAKGVVKKSEYGAALYFTVGHED